MAPKKYPFSRVVPPHPIPRRLAEAKAAEPPFCTVLISYEGDTLEYVTRRPGLLTGEHILDYYEESLEIPLELWNGKKKLTDLEKRVGRMKNLTLKRASSPPTTPSRMGESGSVPAHHQLCSPGATAVEAPYLTPREAYELGMRSPPMWQNTIEVFVRDDGERGVRALKEIRNGQFVCEYEANLLSKEECEKAEQEYESEGKAVYILEAHGYYFDPTMRPNAVGKYINHAAKGGNVTLFPPIPARGRIRIGFVSVRDIDVGEELFFDYGYRDSAQKWTFFRKRKSPAPVDAQSEEEDFPVLHPNSGPRVPSPVPKSNSESSTTEPTSVGSNLANIEEEDDAVLRPSPVPGSICGSFSAKPEKVDSTPTQENHHTKGKQYTLLIPNSGSSSAEPVPVMEEKEDVVLVSSPAPSSNCGPSSVELFSPGSNDDPTHSRPFPETDSARSSQLGPCEDPLKTEDEAEKGTFPLCDVQTPGPSATSTPIPTSKQTVRKRRPCPIPECKGAQHVNLWNHIFQTHKAQGKYSMDELRKFMEISKLQNPRTRSKTKVLPEVRPSNTVKEEDDGSVTITKVEIKPTSSGRERFGSGTKNWGKYPLDTPCLEAFSRYLQSVEGGSKNPQAAQQEVVDLSKFLYAIDDQTCCIDNVTTMSNVVKYLNRLRESGVGPSGQITKLTTLMDAMKMIITRIPDDGGDEQTKELVVRTKIVETKIKGIAKSLRKESSLIRLQKRELFDADSNDRERVLTFLEDKRLAELVKGYLEKVEMNDGEHLTARRYLMCYIMYRNAQRQGPIVNLTLTEFRRALSHKTRDGETVYVYKVWQHKTSGVFGSANLVVPESIHEMVCHYVEKHRPTPEPECNDVLFLTPQGKKVAHLSDDLRLLSKDFPTALGEMKLTATQMRKLTTTQVATGGASDDTLRTVAAHMTHAADTAKKYYQHLEGASQSVKAYDEISRKRPAEEEPPAAILPKMKRRRKWLTEEDQCITETFDMAKTPSLEQCQQFLQEKCDGRLFVDRTPKELQDKCRTIMRQSSKL